MASNEEQLKQKIQEYFNYEVKIEKLFWEIVPAYIKFKCPELPISSVSLVTDPNGKKIHTSLYLINTLSFVRIAHLLTDLDLIGRSASDKCEPFSYSFQELASVQGQNKLYKYILTTENLTDEDLAGKSKHFITSLYICFQKMLLFLHTLNQILNGVKETD